MPDALQTIRETFSTRRRTSKARHRDIAESLGISEGALIAAHLCPTGMQDGAILLATRLRTDWPELIAALEPLGEVMGLTRNVSCVHEKTGVYQNVRNEVHVGLVLGGAIDLRLFYQQWKYGFAVIENTTAGMQRSLQFFDAEGTAIHKVFLKPQSHVAAYTALVQQFRAQEDGAQEPIALSAEIPAAPAAEKADTDIDVNGFRAAWDSLRDTHAFFGLLKSFGVTRTQALRLADPKYAQRVDTDICQGLLQAAAAGGVPIMVFVGNPGMIQIHSGPIQTVAVMGPWLNVLDPAFNLHLREDHIASAWILKKPTVDGLVTSLELFDAQGDTIAQFFGERKPGTRELCEWRTLIDRLQQESQPCNA